MYDRPARDRAFPPSMVFHASRADVPSVGSHSLRASTGSSRLGALFLLIVLVWVMIDRRPIEWERVVLVLALLRLAQDVAVSWSSVDLR